MGGGGGGGFVLPADEGDGRDDGAKFRDLVWVPDEEKVTWVVFDSAKHMSHRSIGQPIRNVEVLTQAAFFSCLGEDGAFWM